MGPNLGDTLADAVDLAEHLAASPWFYVCLLLAVAIDALIPLLPGEVILTTGGTLVATRSWEAFIVVVAVGATGALTGDLASYWVGSRGRSLADRLRPDSRAASLFATATRHIERRGIAVLIGARFIPGGRTAATLAAGCVGVPRRRFMLVSAGSAIVWSAYTTLLGVFGGVAVSSNPMTGAAIGVGLGIVIGAVMQRFASRSTTTPDPGTADRGRFHSVSWRRASIRASIVDGVAASRRAAAKYWSRSPCALRGLGRITSHQASTASGGSMSVPAEFLVSKSGQMSVPAQVRHRWGLDDGGRVTVIDLGNAVVLLPPGARHQLLDDALSAEEHRAVVERLDDPDLATT